MNDPKPKKATKRPGESAKPEAFDLWLKRGLHQIYDGVAKEPIPDELLKLIEDDRKK
nr:NepR family anti-sigma factor [Acidisphaera sp. L21]